MRGVVRGRVADGDGDGHEARELGQRERLVAGREVARRRDLRLDEEQVRAVLGAERAQAGARPPGVAATNAGEPAAWISAMRRATRSSRMGAAYASASASWTSSSGAVAMRSRTGVRILVARLDALEVEHRQRRRAAPARRRTRRRRRRPWPPRGSGSPGRGRRSRRTCRRRRARASRCPGRARRRRSRRSGGACRSWTAAGATRSSTELASAGAALPRLTDDRTLRTARPTCDAADWPSAGQYSRVTPPTTASLVTLDEIQAAAERIAASPSARRCCRFRDGRASSSRRASSRPARSRSAARTTRCRS